MQKIKSFLFVIGPLLMSCSHVSAQGGFELDNLYVTNRISVDTPGNPYSGAFGMEVWQSGNTNASLSGALNMAAMTDSLVAYQLLAANEFHLEKTFIGQTMVQGVFCLGEVHMGDIPFEATVTLALAAWNSGAANGGSASASGAKGGLIAFVQPTGYYLITPPVALPDLNWTVAQDLVMMTIPEPAALPLVLLSAVMLLVFKTGIEKQLNFCADDHTWAGADGSYYYFSWCDRLRIWTKTFKGHGITRPDADVKLAKIRQSFSAAPPMTKADHRRELGRVQAR